MMRLGLSAAAFYGRCETEEQAELLKGLPIDCCEVFLETPSEYSASFGALVKDRLDGLPCVSVHPKSTQFEPDLFGRSRRQELDALRCFEGVLDAGVALGASYYVWHGPGRAVHEVMLSRIHELQPRFERLQRMAADRGMRILWENVFWAGLRTEEHVAQLKAMFPGLGFVLDIKQAQRAGVDPFSLMQAMGKDLSHVHMLDWDERGDICLPGSGSFDFSRFFRELRALNDQISVILEPYAYQAEDRTALISSLEALREFMTTASYFSEL